MGISLRRIPALKNLNTHNLKLLQPLFEPFTCSAGTIILQQGTPADYLYLVIKGKAVISYKPYDGHSMTVSHVEKGGLFGWSAVVGSKMYSSSAVAIGELEAVRVSGSALRKFCAKHPGAGREILEILAASVTGRWMNASEQVKSILMQGMQEN